jgi:hypothetical protein
MYTAKTKQGADRSKCKGFFMLHHDIIFRMTKLQQLPSMAQVVHCISLKPESVNKAESLLW